LFTCKFASTFAGEGFLSSPFSYLGSVFPSDVASEAGFFIKLYVAGLAN
jgi:hypothetical protein